MRRAFKVANDPPYGPVFVALPIDVMEQDTANVAIAPGRSHRTGAPDPHGIQEACALLRMANIDIQDYEKARNDFQGH